MAKDRDAMNARILEAMRAGGYVDAIASGGSKLARVREYIERFGEKQAAHAGLPMQHPDYPCFPGLANEPFPARWPEGAGAVEAAFDMLRRDWRELVAGDLLHYKPPKMERVWAVHLLWHMGVSLEPLTRRCAATFEWLGSLPRACLDYPWGDVLYSVQASDAHLRAHCSVDNLRVRCHVGIEVPSGSEMRVASETRTWQEGRALVFEDSFEHEVWNRGRERRVVFIVDFWHPDLTDEEIRALTAGFRHSSVRGQFLLERLAMVGGGVPAAYGDFLRREMRRQDEDPRVREYWRCSVPDFAE